MRYSKQREQVYETIASSMEHLKVEEIYQALKQGESKIGIATVYRNVKELESCGRIRKIKDLEGVDHYDATIQIHPHFICRKCNCVYDIDSKNYDIIEKMQKLTKHTIESIDITLRGICDRCENEK